LLRAQSVLSICAALKASACWRIGQLSLVSQPPSPLAANA
jgi:hypothetical protein